MRRGRRIRGELKRKETWMEKQRGIKEERDRKGKQEGRSEFKEIL